MPTPTPASPIPPRPRVGVGVFILRPNSTTSIPEFILGQRKGSHGAGTWALPGGHLELNESFETCATREIEEETGLRVTNVRFLTATNDVMLAEAKHYITIFVVAEVGEEDSGKEPRIMEPDKCAEWRWVGWEELLGMVEREEGKMFLPLVNLVRTRPGVVPSLL